MNSYKCFNGEIDLSQLDRSAFSLGHNLADHPALSLNNLAKVISELPREKILFSKDLNHLSRNFDDALNVSSKEIDLSQVVETLMTSSSYMAIKNPELHPSFKKLYNELLEDTSALLKANKTGNRPLEPMLWLFIASPNVVTPFHFDRFSNIIMQIRGSKELAVFPPRVEEIISAKDTEAYLDWTGELTSWRPELDKYAKKFQFKKGEAVHIPFVSGHYVKNGSEDISISLSFFFHSDETLKWSKAMRFNNHIRQLGISPNPIGISNKLDRFKALVYPVSKKIKSVFSKF